MSAQDVDATLLHDLGRALEHIIGLYDAMPLEQQDNMPLLLRLTICEVARDRVLRYRAEHPK